MNGVGALGTYALTMQLLQLNIVKQNIETQQQIAEILLDPDRCVPVSADKGLQADFSI